MEMMKDEIQVAYPCYSKNSEPMVWSMIYWTNPLPRQALSDMVFKTPWLTQLTSMAAVVKYSYALLPHQAKTR